MRKRIARLYFPATVPKRRHASLWMRLLGYGDVPLLPATRGALKVARFAFPAAVPAAAGKKILFFSDLHYTAAASGLADELVEKVKELSPDLLLCGGDLTVGAAEIDELKPLLKRLSACVGCCITIPGNWERGKSWLPQSFWHDFFAECNWHYLCNESLSPCDWCWVYGSDDNALGAPEILEPFPEDREKILLVHRPDTVVFLDWRRELEGCDLALCGHTHGGQIRLPLVGSVTFPSHYRRKFDCGLFGRDKKKLKMVVTAGVNHASFPLRLNCRREIVLVEFEQH